jgi:hypothetical protein
MLQSTFKPQIDKKSAKMVEKEAGMVSSREILHKKQVRQKQRAQKLLKDKEAKELKEWTLTPTIISKKNSLNYLPGTENKIQTPSESSLKQIARTFLHDDSSPYKHSSAQGG